ncbi:putative membrane protein [Actinacidiphila reveromycinica]|uniref:Putative membrane protein n=1 Tax=Actinacidiphila reveromycinica TaxID=659352 RepID=A0A7U3UWN7_9ACTN|nr:hypothetical protein [Streptomyces sp. SN-593]BBB00057.1 putative membrane protein [Streptomyces sp. SN-593]
MLILGLLLLACTAAFVGLAIADNLSGGPQYDVTVLGQHIATMNGLALFCAGLALALIFGLGCMMAMTGGILHRRKARRYRAIRKDAAATARERDALAARIEDQGAASSADGAPAPADTAPAPAAVDTEEAGSGSHRAGTRATGPRHRARHLFGH